MLALEDFLERLPYGVVVRDSDDRLISANKAYEEILGVRAPEVIHSSNVFSGLSITDPG